MQSLRLMQNYFTIIVIVIILIVIIKYGAPQISVLGLVLYNIFLCDIFFLIGLVDTVIYPDDNNTYTAEINQ